MARDRIDPSDGPASAPRRVDPDAAHARYTGGVLDTPHPTSGPDPDTQINVA